MATIDGEWESVAQSPMGEQRSTLTLVSQADGGFTGTNSGPMGTIDVKDGKVTGDLVTCKMKMKMPFPMTLTLEARIIDDNNVEGTIDTGMFGKFPVKVTRKV